MDDEQFLAQFANLTAGSVSDEPIILQPRGLVDKDWSLCLLVKIIGDRGVMDSTFISTMRRAWTVSPATDFTNLARNVFLVQFANEQELSRTMSRGIWSYRGDVVALRRINGPEDLVDPKIEEAEVWVQWHRVPAHIITNEGILELAGELGTPLSDVQHAYSAGMRFCRIKVRERQP